MKLIEIPTIQDNAILSFAEAGRHIPFDIKRFFFIYDFNLSSVRGKHANKKLQEVIFCLKGNAAIWLEKDGEKEGFFLDKPHEGLFIDKMTWVEIYPSYEDTILLVVASEYHDKADQIWDRVTFEEFSE